MKESALVWADFWQNVGMLLWMSGIDIMKIMADAPREEYLSDYHLRSQRSSSFREDAICPRVGICRSRSGYSYGSAA
jgi:hypothetical protein